jgi:hypothetical protein
MRHVARRFLLLIPMLCAFVAGAVTYGPASRIPTGLAAAPTNIVSAMIASSPRGHLVAWVDKAGIRAVRLDSMRAFPDDRPTRSRPLGETASDGSAARRVRPSALRRHRLAGVCAFRHAVASAPNSIA